ncbi:hypothetical protein [Pseudomonas uvaldensis]|uniref:hypothetical protein n=1 Tax=Pseudomonas uvaldensis TaxID=2878385 RepID=UPI001E2ACFF3|nr:hypothetical protein [Pseudomonas uvaldensis]MCE0459937.1 hypothetical protein [Pseudomonas uvaldensis]
MERKISKVKATKLGFNEIDEAFSKTLKKQLLDLYPTTSKKIIKDRLHELSPLIEVHRNYKYQAIQREEETEANVFFLMQCILSSIHSAFLMIKLHKDEQNLDSWCSLIDAIEYIDIATRVAHKLTINACTHIKQEIAENHAIFIIKKRLDLFSHGLFRPDMIFTSPGIIESIGDCSICGLPFQKCDHSEGDIVMGRFCQRINRKIIHADHSAIVENPKDRRCIFTSSFNLDNVSIDFFSREPTPQSRANNTYEAIIQHLKGINLR